MTNDAGATVQLLIFSGVADPEWELGDDSAEQLAARVRDGMSGANVPAAPVGGLGYRGFFVRNRGAVAGLPGEFTVYSGVLTQEEGSKVQHWPDAGGAELFLLDDARREGFGELLDAAGIRAEGDEPTRSQA